MTPPLREQSTTLRGKPWEEKGLRLSFAGISDRFDPNDFQGLSIVLFGSRFNSYKGAACVFSFF
jgi:hypothetical protein